MKLNKKLIAISAVALMGIAPFASSTVQAANKVVTKKTMHNSAIYNKDGKNTGTVFASYQDVEFDSDPVKINGEYYYKITYQDKYIKLTNIDGVQRKVDSNAYVYATSTKRANKKVLKKGTTITTYGGSYKFKNGKKYYRVGGPKKQYVKVANLSKSAKEVPTPVKEQEATATVKSSVAAIYTGEGKDDKQLKIVKKNLKVGTKFTVNRFSDTPFSGYFPSTPYPGNAPMYRIKGTNNWLHYADVKVDKELPLYTYDYEHYSYIRFISNADVYNINGTVQDHNGQKIKKQLGSFKVDKLTYIWIPSENKAELFYHPLAKLIDGTFKYPNNVIKMDNGYVKASDVKFMGGIKLAPNNTPK
ncbi:SLAP domain-containing protein, partial [Lactobacillus sp. PSON]|uniref:SLAP domain-containing protein n=1 Tax=Lactobacillus sp. PSON TaxID=3455454 RepID=UPI0040410147